MDYVAALGLVFFTSLPLVAAVHFLRLALKRETIGTSRVVCLVFGLLAACCSNASFFWCCCSDSTTPNIRVLLYSHICFCKQFFSSDEKSL